MLFNRQPKVNANQSKQDNQSQIIIIIVSPRAQMMVMSLKYEEHADHTLSKKNVFLLVYYGSFSKYKNIYYLKFLKHVAICLSSLFRHTEKI